MIRSIIQSLIFLILIVFLWGCAKHQVKPTPPSIDDNSLPKFRDIISVAVEPSANQQTRQFDLCSAGAHSYQVSSDDLTNAAVEVIRDVLRSNGVKIDSNSVKRIRILAIDSKCGLEKMTYRYTTKLRIFAGDSIKKDFSGYRSVGHVFSTSFAIEMTINQAVLETFKDRQIVDYLQN